MSRVHCVACGTSVVVDPQGICPEGHHVGSRGARVEAAMGSHTAHPDEPEPWIYVIEELVGASAGANGHHAASGRELRPLRLPGVPSEGFDDVPADADTLLRELHSLAALEEGVSPPSPQEGSPPGSPPPAAAPQPPAPPTTPTARAARLDRDEMTDAFAELSALDAFSREQDGTRAGGSGTTRTGARPGSTRATNDASGASSRPSRSEPAPARPPAPDGPTHDPDALAALFSSELGAAPQPPPVPSAPAGTGEAEPRDRDDAAPAGDQLDELFGSAVSEPNLQPRDRTTPTEPAAAGSTSGGPQPAEPSDDHVAAERPAAPPTPAPTPEEPAADTPAPPETAPPPATPSAPLDLSSFTAKGGGGRKGGRKRRFGR